MAPETTSPAERYDAAVVGAGPAGSATAIHLARQGRRVALFDKDAFPRDKLCGEFLSPESQRLLDDLGCLAALEAHAPPAIHGARFTGPSGYELTMRLPGTAMGITRRRLDLTLFEQARAEGVDAFDRARVVGLWPHERPARLAIRLADPGGGRREVGVCADFVIGAWGRRTPLDRKLGRAFMRADHPYVGLKRHHRPVPYAHGQRTADALAGHVEIHAFDGGYCGMSGVETGEVNVCMLLEQRFVDRLGRARWSDVAGAVAAANPRLAERLVGLEPSEEGLHAVAQVPFSLKRRSVGPVLFAGDAAGMIAPLTGDGQAMALTSASLLAELLSDVAARPTRAAIDAAARAWNDAWRRRFEPRTRLGRTLQHALLRPRVIEPTLRLVDAVPGLAAALARWTRDAAPA